MNWKLRVLYETNGADHMEEFFCQNKRGAYWAFKTWKGKLACYGVALYLLKAVVNTTKRCPISILIGKINN